MNHIKYTISEIDVAYYNEDSTDIKVQLESQERGRKLLRDIKTLFPNRERISEHGPHKPLGFCTSKENGKSYDYHCPDFSLVIYKKFENIPRRGESIHCLEIIIGSADKELFEEKKKSIGAIIDKYNIDVEHKLKIEYNEYDN
jgi:hypothetical protein